MKTWLIGLLFLVTAAVHAGISVAPPSGSVTAAQIAAAGGVTNQYVYRLYIFQSGYGTNTSIYTNGVWTWQGQNPTNLVLTSRSPIFTDTNLLYNNTVRDPHVTYYMGQYILAWSHYPTGSGKSDGVGVATSLDGYSFTFQGYANVTNSFFPSGSKPVWSPYFFADLTNGLKLLVSLGNTNSSTPTNYFVADVAYPTLTSLSNFRPIFVTNDLDANTHWGGSEIICNGGTVYFFTQQGNEYTNNNLVSYGWKWAYPTNYNAVGGGNLPSSTSIIQYGGWYYLIGSSLSSSGMQLEVSTNLINWIPNLDDPAEPGNSFIPHPATGEASGDGTVVAIPVANSGGGGLGFTPQNSLAATGVSPFDGSGLTNLQSTLIQTNWVDGKWYTNTYGTTISAQYQVRWTTAGVVGSVNETLWVVAATTVGGLTNSTSAQTLVTSLAQTITNPPAVTFIPTNAAFAFTNLSTGSGDSAAVMPGQIKYP